MTPSIHALVEKLDDPAQFRLTSQPGEQVLDMGCGSNKRPGSVGLDISADTDADIVHDLDTFPYPIEDDSFDRVIMQDVIEHVAEPMRVVAEVHRILRPGGRLALRTPHFSSALAYGDPTHRHYYSTTAIRYFAQPGFTHYSAARFAIDDITLDMWLPFRVCRLDRLVNRFPGVYETYFAFRFPAMNIRAEFTAL